ncbi:MAG: 2-C-methyl-D-erythritol 2,4-cyclodiphosphate synthase [Endomicrobium sp.]|jgi:2-C-methyl-D-erythritol 2,4-cyclodiphosphate synthase|nr:2-C-methyl-D-erythritol 2,4-cyclodiphosphate synthase [Endomicrobium sp.]
MYVGLGYDIHRLKKGRKLILGGVNIESDVGLIGHSDADVVIHALIDSFLGAAGLNDIGYFFPNTDLKYKNIKSIYLLKLIYVKLKTMNFFANNVDITVIAEKPKICYFVDEIKNNISKIIKLNKKRISIKATTNEKTGFIGRGNAICAIVISSIIKK